MVNESELNEPGLLWGSHAFAFELGVWAHKTPPFGFSQKVGLFGFVDVALVPLVTLIL